LNPAEYLLVASGWIAEADVIEALADEFDVLAKLAVPVLALLKYLSLFAVVVSFISTSIWLAVYAAGA
jgi:hypothetical protein